MADSWGSWGNVPGTSNAPGTGFFSQSFPGAGMLSALASGAPIGMQRSNPLTAAYGASPTDLTNANRYLDAYSAAYHNPIGALLYSGLETPAYEAAKWAAQNSHLLPVDPRPIAPPLEQAAVEPALAVSTSATAATPQAMAATVQQAAVQPGSPVSGGEDPWDRKIVIS